MNRNPCEHSAESSKIQDALRYLLVFVEFKKREKHSWRSYTFSKVILYKVYVTLFCIARPTFQTQILVTTFRSNRKKKLGPNFFDTT